MEEIKEVCHSGQAVDDINKGNVWKVITPKGQAVDRQGEWTVEWLNQRIENMLPPEALRNVCEWHNAALAAERQRAECYNKRQAVASRKPLVEALESIITFNNITGTEAIQIAADALAKIKHES